MADLEKWDVEDPNFWESKGKKIASRNLWVSIPSLLSGFAVWLYWGILTVQMLNLGFPYEKSQLFSSQKNLTIYGLEPIKTDYLKLLGIAYKCVIFSDLRAKRSG